MIDYDDGVTYELFEACKSGEPGDHWFLRPQCQAVVEYDQRLNDREWPGICARPLGDYPHNEYGEADRVAGTDEGRWHIFVTPATPFVLGENAFRGNVCNGSSWQSETPARACSCPCHWGAYYVNIYALDQGYGGPEEGGWYYETGEVVGSIPVESYAEAVEVAEKYEARYPEGKNRYSVAPRGTDYKVTIERTFAEAWPKHTPHYE